MQISLIAAMDRNRVIGKENDIPWRIPNDWQYVKKTTEGHPIILGRKNFDSIGKALPGRRNIILSRDIKLTIEGCEIAHSIKDVFDLCKNEDEIFIFGGEQIYKMFMPYVEKMYITKIHHEFEGDTFFPEIDVDEWKEVSVEKGIQNDRNPYIYYFHVYERIVKTNQ
ncbi:dihydrofolate reductase (trimethoprim resistance protein) [Fontibacillus solani]|uniref:Dihydrofolate reductase n=1 Tax=Fontibacillus solani TaxID=1572857 RepID=A0A7W3XSI5_9BACL|nr:DfrD/DfrG/DfrK family trimethoprim-resistant dihydrofolate reductase [Fontibacillus solani]MBA9086613.1 dihydrofolate reductase (trimethoprim resistance protein) [Fontibacillus solani]